MKTLLLIALVITGPIPQAAAWNDFGHMMMATIAYDRLTPEVRDNVSVLLRLNPEYATWVADLSEDEKPRGAFLRASRWADDIKRDPAYEQDGSEAGNRPSGPNAARNIGYADTLMHKYWHFVDLPFSPDDTALADPPTPNARTQIALFRAALKSGTVPDALKSYDLVWLIHLVADVHQPLHAATRVDKTHPDGDAGGNGVLVCSAPCGIKERLHGFWDSVLGSGMDPTTAIEQAKELPAADPQLAAIGNEDMWIQESFQAAQQHVYIPPIDMGAGPYELTERYRTEARDLAAQRIALAGARLAHLLNDALR